MSVNGGYHILDFSGTSINASTGTTIAGIHSLIGSMTDKPIIVDGFKVGSNAALPSQFINPYLSGTSFVFKVGAHTVTVTTANLVTVS